MRRQFAIGMLIMAFAGCAQSRSSISKQEGKPPDPVALTPVPPVYETINRGMGGPAIARTVIKNPNDPIWTGRDQVTTAARPVPTGPPNPGQGPAYPAPSVVASGPSGPMGNQALGAASPMAPAQAAAAAPSALAVSELPVPNGLTPAPLETGPGTLEAAGGPMSTQTAMPGPAAVTGPAPSPIPTARTGSSNPIPSGPSSAAVIKRPTNGLPQSAPSADRAVSPSAVQQPLTAAPAGSTKAPVRRTDPLLGPNPDLMPEMPPLSDEKPPPTSSPAPAEAPIELTPASSAPAQPGPDAAAAPEPTGPLSFVAPSAVANKPAPAGKLAAAVPLEPAPEAAALRIPKRRDAEVIKTSSAPSPAPDVLERHLGTEAGRPVARVGDEVITFHDLVVATREQLIRQPGLNEQIFGAGNPLERNKQLDMLARYTLDGLIERSVLIQEAKHAVKDSKQLDKMMEMADRFWKDEQLPSLERQFSADSEQKLKEKFAASGRSLENMRKTFLQDFLAQGFLQDRLKDKMKIELPDLLKYYQDHINDPEFHRPAQITWRELVVETDKYPTREAAREKAVALLEKLRRGEDFAKLARTESDGPTNSRNEGGLMQTSPGGYAVAAVNQAIESLPLRKVSGILEGPTSFHIVRVESRRPAGPASFEDVHHQIRPMLFEEKAKNERAAFIRKLRERTLITIALDEVPRKAPSPIAAK